MSLQTAFQTVAPPPLPVLTGGASASLATLPKLGGPIAGPAPDKPADLGAMSQANAARQGGAEKINAQAAQGLKAVAKAENAGNTPAGGGAIGLPTIGATLLAAAFPGAAMAITVGGIAAEAAVSLFPTYASRGPGGSKDKKVKNEETSVFQTASANSAAASASLQVNRSVDIDAFARASALMNRGRAGIGDNVKTFSPAGSTYSDYALTGEALRGIEKMKLSLTDAKLNSARILKMEVPQLNAAITERKADGLQVTGANIAEIGTRAPVRQTAPDRAFAFGV